MTCGDRMNVLADLLQELAVAFGNEGCAGGDLATKALRNADLSAYRRRVSQSDPSTILADACRLPGALPISQLVLQSLPMLDWTSWEGEGLSAEVSKRLYTTELVGPDGHFHCESVRVGLLVSDRDTDYPVSSHAGEETYFVIAGTAAWTVGKKPYTKQRPGTLVHHPAWCPHGRRCDSEPFLGAWRWSGDLDLSTFSVAK